MDQKYRDILDTHQQLRNYSCFQMAPELALKFAGIIDLYDSPFQEISCWDGKGFEPYASPHNVGKYCITFASQTFQSPYCGLSQKLENELKKGFFPVVSLQPAPGVWHGYVVLEKISGNDFVVVTKKGSLEGLPCTSEEDKLSNRTANGLKVDCLFWQATPYE